MNRSDRRNLLRAKVIRVAAATGAATLCLTLAAGPAAALPAAPAVPVGILELLGTGSLDLGSLGSLAPVDAELPHLASVDNFRDVAGVGAGYANQDGQRLNRGVFYRSNAITASDADVAALAGLGLSTVYDLRTAEEVAGKADRLPDGVAYRNIPILSGDLSDVASKLDSTEAAMEFLAGLNRDFVTGENERAGFAELLTELSQTDGPLVFHCTTGKDRAGWATMLLQHIAGLDDDTIMRDYLLTNERSAKSAAATLEMLVELYGEQVRPIYGPLLGVDASYLQAGLDQLAADYETVDNYLVEGLGLSPATIDALRDKLVG